MRAVDHVFNGALYDSSVNIESSILCTELFTGGNESSHCALPEV